MQGVCDWQRKMVDIVVSGDKLFMIQAKNSRGTNKFLVMERFKNCCAFAKICCSLAPRGPRWGPKGPQEV